MRIRVVPSSNIESDLIIKEEVIKLAIDYVYENFDENKDVLIKNIEESILEFQNKTLKNYNAVVSLQMHNFYNKAYDGKEELNGEYLTLLINIGKHEGDNWWGSIYPVFLEKSSTDVVKYESYILNKFKGK